VLVGCVGSGLGWVGKCVLGCLAGVLEPIRISSSAFLLNFTNHVPQFFLAPRLGGLSRATTASCLSTLMTYLPGSCQGLVRT